MKRYFKTFILDLIDKLTWKIQTKLFKGLPKGVVVMIYEGRINKEFEK